MKYFVFLFCLAAGSASAQSVAPEPFYIKSEKLDPNALQSFNGVGLVLLKFDVIVPGDTSETFIGNFIPMRCDLRANERGIIVQTFTDLTTGQPIPATDVFIFKHRPKMRLPKKE